MNIENVLLTGSDGFIGQHLSGRLSEIGKHVLCYGNRENGFDITNKLQIESLSCDKIQAIIHLAGKTSVAGSERNPYETYYTNILGTLNMLDFARLRNIRKLIYVSTFVYGVPIYLPIDENHPTNPHSPYNKSKLLAEEICQNYCHDFGIEIVVLRPFNVYGPGSKPYTLISSLILQLQNNSTILLSGKNVKRDFIFVKDFVNLVTIILNKFPQGYNVYNVGYGKSHTLEEVTKIIAQLLNKEIDIDYDTKLRPGHIMNLAADISKVTSSFSWRPLVNLKKGLKLTIENL